MKIEIDETQLEQINHMPFISPSEESVPKQLERLPDDVRAQVLVLLQTVIHELNSEYRLIKLEIIKEQKNASKQKHTT